MRPAMLSCTLALLAGGPLSCQRGAATDAGSSSSDDASSGQAHEAGEETEGSALPPEPDWAYGVWSWTEVRNQGEQHRAHNLTVHESRRYDYANESCDISGGSTTGSALSLGWDAVSDDILKLTNDWPTSPWFGNADVFYMRVQPDCRVAGLYATLQAAESFAEPILMVRRGALCVEDAQACSAASVQACGEVTPCEG